MLDEYTIDVLNELTNIGMGRAAVLLNDLLEDHVDLGIPRVDLSSPQLLSHRLERHASPQLACVRLDFTGNLVGSASLIFSPQSAANLVAILSGEGEEEEDLDLLKVATLTEVGNIVLNSIMGTLANLLERQFDYRVPVYLEASPEQLVHADAKVLCVNTSFKTRGRVVEGDILLIFRPESLELLRQYLATCRWAEVA
ncbi:MAG: chemotaxis protein CheC [Candidatus Eremiobacteraeota bacterium]|nr:chemotaxis protein CheC [Candidatus Eremiobacteraeota bacterium]